MNFVEVKKDKATSVSNFRLYSFTFIAQVTQKMRWVCEEKSSKLLGSKMRQLYLEYAF
jgi:hypothetical protein